MPNTLPELHPEELAWIEKLAGRKLSNDEAQELIREKHIWDAWMNWVEGNKK